MPTSSPGREELDASEQRISEVSAPSDRKADDPIAGLLRSAAGPSTDDERADHSGFARMVAESRAAPSAPGGASLPGASLPGASLPGALRSAHSTRLRLRAAPRRDLVVKAAIVAGAVVIGVSGAAAATTAIVTTRSSQPPITTSTTAPVTTSSSIAPDPRAPEVSTSTIDVELPPDTATATTVPVAPPSEAPSSGAREPLAPEPPMPAPPIAERSAGEAPVALAFDPGATGAANGNSPNAGGNSGGNPAPGANGAAHGNSPNAGGRAATIGAPGAVTGNGAARSRVPFTPEARPTSDQSTHATPTEEFP